MRKQKLNKVIFYFNFFSYSFFWFYFPFNWKSGFSSFALTFDKSKFYKKCRIKTIKSRQEIY